MVHGQFVTVWKSEVPGICDRAFWAAFDVWYRWKLYGLPFGGLGWADHPAHLLEVIETAEAANRSE
jgi:hypothetical protein